jgi:hypothetical protein
MSPEDLLSYWRRTYGDAPLVGHALRERFPQRWLRIHNLPDAKRYAETEDEQREILRRQNELFSELLGDGGPGEFIFGYYGEEERLPEEVHAALRGLRPEFLTMEVWTSSSRTRDGEASSCSATRAGCRSIHPVSDRDRASFDRRRSSVGSASLHRSRGSREGLPSSRGSEAGASVVLRGRAGELPAASSRSPVPARGTEDEEEHGEDGEGAADHVDRDHAVDPHVLVGAPGSEGHRDETEDDARSGPQLLLRRERIARQRGHVTASRNSRSAGE